MTQEHERRIEGTQVTVVEADLTEQQVDVIVNAANEHLRHGGGVAAAIARAGGPVIQQASDEWVAQHGPLADGQAATTTAGDLPAEHVVHVAGPVFDPDADTNEPRLRAAVRAALDAAAELGARSIAFPAISAGIYGYPPEEATRILADEVVAWVREGGEVDEARLVGYDSSMADLFVAALTRAADE